MRRGPANRRSPGWWPRPLSRSALIDAYDIGRLVASGYVWPLGEPADEAARQVRLLTTIPVPSCRHRNDIRPPERQFFNGYEELRYEELRASMHDDFGRLGWWFDTSDLDPGQTAQRILDEGVRRALLQR